MLRLADRVARRQKTSRSEFIRAAVREGATNREREFGEEARRKRQREAVETMDRIAHNLGNWPAEEVPHAWRYRLAGDKE